MDTALNFINCSSEHRSLKIVIFQKNLADEGGGTAVAWKVIQHCGPGENHPFTVPDQLHVSTANAWGNHTPRLPAQSGQMFHAFRTHAANSLRLGGVTSSPGSIEVGNQHLAGTVDAGVYRDGRLLAVRAGVPPGHKAVFEFKPTLWIGLAARAVQGQVMSEALVSEINTELSLLGVAAADIVMTGGGPGPEAMPFQFSLHNVVMA